MSLVQSDRHCTIQFSYRNQKFVPVVLFILVKDSRVAQRRVEERSSAF